MAAHFLHRNAAEENWADADDASAVDAAIYQALMANYAATAELIGFLDTIAAAVGSIESKLDRLGT